MIVVYADHDGIRTDARPLDDVWLELFEERQEQAARHFGNAFCVEASHTASRSWERRDPPGSAGAL